MTRVICMWAAPRNVSTAMMYAWNQREDTTVLDEPMYAHYLDVTGLDHPVRDEVMASLPTSEDAVVASMVSGSWDTPYVFIKNMAHHLKGMDSSFIAQMDNFLLTRDPLGMIPSLQRGLGTTPTMRDAAYGDQVKILDEMIEIGQEPVVVDSHTLLDDPHQTLRTLCQTLDVPWDPAMLSWPVGPKEVDGIWGPHWYTRLHTSTGFEPYVPSIDPLPDELADLIDACTPLYERLSSYAIG